MPPENGNNNPISSNTGPEPALQPIPQPPTEPTPNLIQSTVIQPTVTPTPAAAQPLASTEPSSAPLTPTQQNISPVSPPGMPPTSPVVSGSGKKFKLPHIGRKMLFVLGIVILIVAVAAIVFSMNKNSPKESTMNSAITLPKDATITAECVEMRGKQYILPKDIPMGPIYDVHEGKVIAVEYLVSEEELTKTPDMFSNLGLPAAAYDHLTVMPMDPHAGEDKPHFHVIAYLIPATEVAQITCANPSPHTNTSM